MLMTNARALIGHEFCDGVHIRIADDRFTEISLTEPLEPHPGEASIDVSGFVLAPGFVDIHIHGYGGCDTMNGLNHIRSMSAALPKHGVTAFLPTTMADSIPRTRAALAAAHQLMGNEDDSCARVIGCHLEGPFLHESRKGAQPAQFLIHGTMDNFLAIAKGHEDAVKLMTVAPDVPMVIELIEDLGRKFNFSLGHTSASADLMLCAAAAGASQVTHMFNAMTPFNHRNPGPIGAALATPQLGVQLIADLVHVHPVALTAAYRAKGPDRCYLITDAMEATGMPDGQYMLGVNHVTVEDGRATLSDGTIAGSTLTLDVAVGNMIAEADVPPAHALYMASTAPANAIGAMDHGRIAAGAFADFLLLDESFRPRKVFIGGHLVHST